MNVHTILRLNSEPCIQFSEAQVHQLIMERPREFCELLERLYKAWNRNNDMVTLPYKQVFSTHGTKGDFRVMPCVLNFEGKFIKAVKVIGTNEEERIVPDKICVGRAMLLHPTDNFVQALFEVCSLSCFRTAAISVLAFKHSSPGLLRPGIIGAGRIGFYTALFLKEWLGIREIAYFDLNPRRGEDFKFGVSLIGRVQALAFGSVEEISAASDALFLCTNSPIPVISKKMAGHIPFVSSVGADADNLSELAEDMAEGRRILVDSIQSLSMGDLKRWEEKGLIRRDSVMEMRSIMGPEYRPDTKTLFISTGVAVQDALACQFLFDQSSLKAVLPPGKKLSARGDGVYG